jgi:hypothetical protein
MANEGALREYVRRAMLAGKLPRQEPRRMWAGRREDIPCAVCALPITSDEVGYELQFDHDGRDPGLDRFYFFHLRCFTVWELERTKP